MRTYTQTLDIPEIDQIPDVMKILDDLSVGNNVFLKGIAGTGKTTLAEKVAYAHFGRRQHDKKELPFIIITCNQYTSPIDIKGGQTIYGYKEGGLIEAWRDGKILIIDELPKLDPNTAGLLNDPLAKTAKQGAIIFNGLNKPIEKHPDFGCIATGNVIGKAISSTYIGNNKQDASLLDRFSGSIYEIGFNEPLERSLVYPPLADTCIAIRNSILRYEGRDDTAEDMEDIMTLRTMLNFQRIYLQEMLRETGIKDHSGRSISGVKNGKTLKDCIESYFRVISREKADHIKKEVNIVEFLNRYKGAEMKQVFIEEYKRRNR
ncbi:AAA domain-containing protein [Aquimarina sp. TRL1]|uniref:AAA family ATPase n=1 Tax=Aquimarina sp. (strain TRL1) TaxID=2736252 RepID=UPI001588600E|nr:AAA family ATPase [Aquimarina sp. TRL1]QKX05346.1 AAA domain-containing protein [Aquimarina sp. TRL1]